MLLQPELTAGERFSSNARRTAHRDALRQIIVEIFEALTAEQVVQRLEAAQIANARVNDMHDVWQHPQLQARGRWTQVDTRAGPCLRCGRRA